MKDIISKFKNLTKELPKFTDGRVDYSNADVCIVMTIFIKNGEEILLLKRSEKVGSYQGKWNAVSGYIDDNKPIKEKALEELEEELDFKKENIALFNVGKIFQIKNTGKKFIVQPILVKVKEKPEIKLDWEHTEFLWIDPEKIKDFDTVPYLERSWKNANMM